MNMAVDYKKQKSKATRGIVASAAILVLALSIGLAGLFFYLDAWAEARKCQQREELFNPWADSSDGYQDSYKTGSVIGLTEEFASDFKETYHYYFAFDEEWYPVIVKMKGALGEEFQPLMDYVYTDGTDEPEPIVIRGVAAPIEDDIREFAIECMNILYDDEFMTEENFEDYLGISFLDLSRKPVGRADFSIGGSFGIAGAIMAVLGALGLWTNIKNRKKAVLAQQRQEESMRQAAVWQNPEEGSFTGSENQGTGGYKSLGGGMGQNPYGYTGSDVTGYTDGSGVRLVPVKKSNVFLGILGAVGGSLIGVAIWLAISAVGFIAGFAGFLMLKFALMGYGKLSGRLDKKGAVISLVIAAFMVLFANVLDYVIVMCQAFFQWDASLDTVRYVIMNFGSLMTEADTWGGFYLNLVLGYALSIWSSYQLIGRILSYKE